MKKRQSAREVIPHHLGMDFAEMPDYRYQPTRYLNPAVYTFGNDYYAAPSKGKMPPNYCDLEVWNISGEEHGRKIFKAVSA
jgi:hypothetical protein